jgi:hypothetical protein
MFSCVTHQHTETAAEYMPILVTSETSLFANTSSSQKWLYFYMHPPNVLHDNACVHMAAIVKDLTHWQ